MGKNNQSDFDLVDALATLLQERDLAEIEYSLQDASSRKIKVRLSREAGKPRQRSADLAGPSEQAPASMPDPAPNYANDPDPSARPGVVVSPMVGTTYLQPEPGAAKFTEIGQEVAEGQTILIVEAMKTMNHIPAPHSGTVRRIFVEDGAPVEYGAPLMVIA